MKTWKWSNYPTVEDWFNYNTCGHWKWCYRLIDYCLMTFSLWKISNMLNNRDLWTPTSSYNNYNLKVLLTSFIPPAISTSPTGLFLTKSQTSCNLIGKYLCHIQEQMIKNRYMFSFSWTICTYAWKKVLEDSYLWILMYEWLLTSSFGLSTFSSMSMYYMDGVGVGFYSFLNLITLIQAGYFTVNGK